MGKLAYQWHLRRIMADRGLFKTTDLAPLLAERGIVLSPAQVYRLVTQTPERLSLRVLMALCDALDCTSVELIEPVEDTAAQAKRRRAAGGDSGGGDVKALRPTRARIVKGN